MPLQYLLTRTHSYVPLIDINETSKDQSERKVKENFAVKKAIQKKIID